MKLISKGDWVLARDAADEQLERRALTGVVMGQDFEVVWVVRPQEWESAVAEGREPQGVPWPAEDVQVAS